LELEGWVACESKEAVRKFFTHPTHLLELQMTYAILALD
jgi:hypothetical protein